MLTAASDPNFRNLAVQHRWHEHSEAALVSFLHACAGPITTRLLNAVLSSLEDLEFIIVRLQTALPALPARCTLTNQWTLLHAHRFKSVCLALCLTPTSTSAVNWQTQAHSAVALIWQMCRIHATLWLLCVGVMTGLRRLSSPVHVRAFVLLGLHGVEELLELSHVGLGNPTSP